MKGIFFLAILFLFASCKQNDKNDSVENSVNDFTSSDGTITLVNPVMRPGAKGMNSAIFLSIVNNSDKTDTLYSAESSKADLVQVHETFKVTEDKMGMRHAEKIRIQANSTLELKPGGYHIMLIDLNEDVTLGEKVEAKLLFENAGTVEFSAVVTDLINISK